MVIFLHSDPVASGELLACLERAKVYLTTGMRDRDRAQESCSAAYGEIVVAMRLLASHPEAKT